MGILLNENEMVIHNLIIIHRGNVALPIPGKEGDANKF